MSNFSIENIDATQDLSTTESSLEFLLVSFCKHFALKPKQAAGLLTQGGKYLAYIVAKGLRGKHESIVGWYQDIFGSLKHLSDLMDREEASGSVSLILSSLKSGFISKSIDTVTWCCRLYSRLASELQDKDLWVAGWDWFVSEGGGLEGCLLSCRRYGPDIKSSVVSVLTQFSRNRLLELFSVHLRRLLNESIHYFTIVNEFLPCLCDIKAAKQEILASGTVDFWIDLGLKDAAGDLQKPTDLRLAALNFLSDLWALLPSMVESREELAGSILTLMKRACRDKLHIMRVACLGKLFYLLDVFTQEKHSYAPVVYKTLTFSLVENYQDIPIREFIQHNFAVIFNKVESIPVGILVEPLVKQLQMSTDLKLNTADFSFLCEVAQHPRLSVKNAVQLIDIFGKIYANEIEFAKAASVPYLILSKRFEQEEAMQEYLFRFSRYAVKLTFNLAAKRISKEKINSILSNEKPSKDKFLILQRNLMLDMVYNILKLNFASLNERIKTELLKTNASLKRMNSTDCRPLIMLLETFGEPIEIMENFEKNEPVSMSPPETATAIVPSKGRALLDIEKVRQQRDERKAERMKKEETDKRLMERTKRVLKQQLEKRKIEIGGRSDTDTQYLPLTDLEKEGVEIIIKRYQKALRVLFKNYASTGYTNKDINSFDRLAGSKLTLTTSEYYKLLKEQGFNNAYVTVEEVTKLLRSFCHHHKKAQIKLNFQEFTDILAQTARMIYSKPPKDLSHLAPEISLKTMIDHFRRFSSISTKLYDDPDPGFGDREVVERLNKELAKNPDIELPENYRRFEHTEIDISYHVPEFPEITPAVAISLEILDEILHKNFHVHILEPTVFYRTVYTAKGILPKAKFSIATETGNQVSERFGMSGVGITYHKASYQPSQPVEVGFSPGLKYEIARLTGKYPSNVLNESAKLIDDLVYSVEIGSEFLVHKNEKTKVQNRAMSKRENDKYMKELEEFRKEKQRRLRKQVVEEKLRKERDEKEAKQKEIEDLNHAKAQEKMRLEYQNEMKKAAEREEKLQKIAKWKAERENFLQKQLEKQEQIKILKEEEKRNSLKDFLKKEKQKIKHLLNDAELKSQQKIQANNETKFPSINRKQYKKESKSFNLQRNSRDQMNKPVLSPQPNSKKNINFNQKTPNKDKKTEALNKIQQSSDRNKKTNLNEKLNQTRNKSENRKEDLKNQRNSSSRREERKGSKPSPPKKEDLKNQRNSSSKREERKGSKPSPPKKEDLKTVKAQSPKRNESQKNNKRK